MVLAARGRVPPVAPAAGSDGMGRVRGAPPRFDVDVTWTAGVDVDALARTATRPRQGHRRSRVDPAAASRAGDADSVAHLGRCVRRRQLSPNNSRLDRNPSRLTPDAREHTVAFAAAARLTTGLGDRRLIGPRR